MVKTDPSASLKNPRRRRKGLGDGFVWFENWSRRYVPMPRCTPIKDIHDKREILQALTKECARRS